MGAGWEGGRGRKGMFPLLQLLLAACRSPCPAAPLLAPGGGRGGERGDWSRDSFSKERRRRGEGWRFEKERVVRKTGKRSMSERRVVWSSVCLKGRRGVKYSSVQI